ncbi:MAG: APC family permease, partial [Chitinophagaceae bacterium]|nr:APC family permease [Chitinophagaceae bacterium]
LPVSGGYYKVISYAYHPSIAFGINCVILVSNAASSAAVALVGSEYITGFLLPLSTNIDYLKSAANAEYVRMIQISIAIISVVIFYGINMMGLYFSARTQTILTIIKISLVVLLITPLFFASGNAPEATAGITGSVNTIEAIKAFGVGLVAVSFTFGGYQQTINIGGEVDKPNKTIPRGIFLGILAIAVLYLLINYAYVRVIGFETLKSSKNIAAIMASKIFGQNAERILSVLLFLGVLAYINGQLISNPRVMFAMSDDKLLPGLFQQRNSRGALKWSVSFFAALIIVIVFWAKEFDKILGFTIFLDCFGMVLSAASIFILRKRTAHLDGTGIYKMKLYPLLPIIFIAGYVFVALSITVDNYWTALTGLGVLAVFIILYFTVYKNQQKQIPGGS